MNSVIPCRDCFKSLINAGVVEIVVERIDPYDPYSGFLINHSSITIRKFELG
jgi:deoxycytidylate deaminase